MTDRASHELARIRIPGIGIKLTLRVVETTGGYVWADGIGFAWRKNDGGTWNQGDTVWVGDNWGVGA